jgi:transcriptional antiterminator NusG
VVTLKVFKLTENNMKWYVVHTYSGHEERVKKNLGERIQTLDLASEIGRVEVPTEEEVEVKNGQRRSVRRKILPGYVIVQMAMNDRNWQIVRNTPGVTGFVGTAGKPTPLQDHEVQRIITQMEAEAPRVKVGFKKGQSVRVVDGPFIDFIGVIDEVNTEKGKIKVLLSLFGRETPVELDFLQVEKL